MDTPSTTPATPDVGSTTQQTPSLDDRLAKTFGLTDDEPAPATQQDAPASPETDTQVPETTEAADPDALTDADLGIGEGEEAKPSEGGEEWLELDRKGELRKVSKEEAKRLAQQGWDYEQKMADYNAAAALTTQLREQVQARGAVTEELLDARADRRMLEKQMANWEGFDWAAYGRTNPLEYPEVHANFTMLRDAYAEAVHREQALGGMAQQIDLSISQVDAAREHKLLYDRAPELRDKSVLKVERGRVVKALQEMGAGIDAVRLVNGSAEAFLIVRDALRYRQAVASRNSRKAQPIRPAAKPGVAPQRQTPASNKADTIKALHQAKDPERKKALLDRALEIKFGIK